VQDKSEKLGVRAWIYMWPGGSILESSASFQRIENETKCLPRPSFGEGFLQRRFDIVSCPDRFFSLMVGREKKGSGTMPALFLCRNPPSLRWLLIGINEDFLEATNHC